MKLLRYGQPGAEKPGILDSDGAIRDLSGVIPDVAGAAISPEGLAKLSKLDLKTLPKVDGNPRLGPCVVSRPQHHEAVVADQLEVGLGGLALGGEVVAEEERVRHVQR